ncbi:MAG: hypothetical protein COA78_38020 [Blastopirellula sp.]|nr:MAG: hypothetical protein COA78_38020 [Blastopirellula sp.]
MTSNKLYTYGWDSEVFIAWFQKDPSKDLASIGFIIEEVENNRAIIVLSSLVFSEVTQHKKSATAYNEFRDFCDGDNVEVLDVRPSIAILGGQFRTAAEEQRKKEFAASGKHSTKKIKGEDSIMLATASLAQVDVFHSEDLSSLSGSPVVNGLKISKPKDYQGRRLLKLGL